MPFKIRSSRRDEGADTSRLASIKRSIENAIAEAEKEKIGLKNRIDQAQNQASQMMGNDTSDYLDREPAIERQLIKAEEQLSAGRIRIGQLNAHLGHLHRLLKIVEQPSEKDARS
jgi:hypothetical protein